MGRIRRFLDQFLLSDHEWKKKYCPHLYHYLFEMTDEERSAALSRIDGTGNYISMLKGAGHDNQTIINHLVACGEVPVCQGKGEVDGTGTCHSCGGTGWVKAGSTTHPAPPFMCLYDPKVMAMAAND